MEKELRDYAHLYLGCEVYIFPPATVTDGWLKEMLAKIDELGYKYILTIDNLIRTVQSEYSLILRPLSSMTEDECNEYNELFDKMYSLNKLHDQMMTEASITKWMLSKHFDLFSLIHAGLAVDATTLPKEPTSTSE